MQLVPLLFLGLLLIAGPVVASILGKPLGGVPTTMLIGTGIVLTLISALLLIITKLYVKTKANEAFVRTGMGGMKVVQDGGAIVFPVIHELVVISLETIRLQVSRHAGDALITKDKLRADIAAEFFVRVQPNADDIQSAARSFGPNMKDTRHVTGLVEDKLISALRNVAATKTLEELNTQRDEFIARVTEIVSPDLKHNGLTLETATISKLDQTDPVNLRDTNIFDAQGLKTIALTTQEALTERNRLEREGELARKTKDVETRQKVLALEKTQKETESKQEAEVLQFQAQQRQETKVRQTASDRTAELADVEKQQTIEVAQQRRAQATEVAEREKQRALTEADQKVEVAQRDKDAAIAQAEQLRANAEAARATAEAARETAMQGITTVKVTAEAEREKQKQIIAAQATAEKDYVVLAKQADGEAYKTQKDAEAKKLAASAEAEAITKKADAEASAAKVRAEADQATRLVEVAVLKHRADADKAIAMIPVDVAAKQVEVDKKRVEEVLKPELEAREKSGKVAQDFELAKLRIEKETEWKIATAHATAQFYGKITANVYGTPEDVAKMSTEYLSGMGIANRAEGFLDGAGDKTHGAIGMTGTTLLNMLQSITDHLGVKKGQQPQQTLKSEVPNAPTAEARGNNSAA